MISVFFEYSVVFRILESKISKYELFVPILELSSFEDFIINDSYSVSFDLNKRLITYEWDGNKHIDPFFVRDDGCCEVIIYKESFNSIENWEIKRNNEIFTLDFASFLANYNKPQIKSKIISQNKKIIINKIGEYELVNQTYKDNQFYESVDKFVLEKKDLPYFYDYEVGYYDYQALIVNINDDESWEEKYVFYGQLGHDGKYIIDLRNNEIIEPYHKKCLNNNFLYKVFYVEINNQNDYDVFNKLIEINLLNNENNFFEIKSSLENKVFKLKNFTLV